MTDTVVPPVALDDAPDALTTLVRRARVTALPDGRPQEMMRLAGLPLLMAAVVASTTGTTYTVRPGDTLSGIARRLGTDPTTLAQANRLRNPDRIRVGQRLAVPRQATPAHDDRDAATASPAVTYTVRAGDTVWAIARRSGSTVEAIIAANRLRPDALIRPGTSLVLPGATTSPDPAGGGRRYTVQAGDTVGHIAARFGVSVASIVRANRLDARALIRTGQRLVVPGVPVPRTAEPAPPATTPPTHWYVVGPGDTLSGVAERERVPVAEILVLNGLDARGVLHPGQRLRIPGSAPLPESFLGRGYPDAVTQAAGANRRALAATPAPSSSQVQAMIAATARGLGVDPALALAVAYQESGFDQHQVSPANAIGVMQVIPSSGTWASELVGRRLDLLSAEDNVVAGVAILATLLAHADEPTALAAYYQGLGSVRRNGMFPDTRRYVASVQTLLARFR
jgi:LysM repeat protein